MRTVTDRVAVVLAIAFIGLMTWAIAVPAHSGIYSCGIWVSPKLTDASVASQVQTSSGLVDSSADLGLDTTNLQAATIGLVQAKQSCDSKLSTRKTLTWVGLGGALLAPPVIWFVAGSARRRDPVEA